MDSNASQAADADLATAVAAGDREALAAIFDRYAPRLLAFSQSMLHHRADAEDCLQDIFILTATRISGLREPDRLRSWLFAIARHECLRRLERKTREVLVDAVPEPRHPARGSTSDAPAAAALDDELASLLSDAIAGLADRDRLVLDLADRQGLATDEVAAALSMSPSSTYKLLTRARATARRSIGALLVARTGRDNCTELNALLGNWNGSMTPLLRKRVARHIEDCALCQEQEKRVASPAALLGAGTAFAMPIPIGLRSHILDTAYEARAGSFVLPPTDPWVHGWPPRSPNVRGSNVFGSSGAGGAGAGGTGAGGAGAGPRGPALAVAAAVAVLLLIGAFVAIGRPSINPEAVRGPLPVIFPSSQRISPSTTTVTPTSTAIMPPVIAPTAPTGPAATTRPTASTRPGPPTKATGHSTPTAARSTADSVSTTVAATTIPGRTTQPATAGSDTTSAAPSTRSSTGSGTSTPQTSAGTQKSSITGTSTTSRRATSPTRAPPIKLGAAPRITDVSVICQYSKSAGARVPLLSWTTTNTHTVDLSVDNPGMVGSYGTGYPPSGQLELPPNGCDPSQGTQVYTLYALEDGEPMAQQTINWVPPAATAPTILTPSGTSTPPLR